MHPCLQRAQALENWTEAAVQGAMNGWSNPDSQQRFRQQTSELASETTNAAVDGALAGITEPHRVGELKQRLREVLESTLSQAAAGLAREINPQLRAAGHSLLSGVTTGIEQELAPALRSGLRDQVMKGLAEGVRDELGGALAGVVKDDLTPAIENELGEALARVMRKSVEQPLLRVLDRAGALSSQVRDDTTKTSRKVAWALGAMLIVVALIAALAWFKVKRHVQTVTLLTRAIKEHVREPGVRRLIDNIRKTGRGTGAGNNLDRFLNERPTLRVNSPGLRDPASLTS